MLEDFLDKSFNMHTHWNDCRKFGIYVSKKNGILFGLSFQIFCGKCVLEKIKNSHQWRVR